MRAALKHIVAYLQGASTARRLLRDGIIFVLLLVTVQTATFLFAGETSDLGILNDTFAVISSVAAALGMAYGAWWSYRFDRKLGNAWRFFTLAMAAWVAGDLLWTWYELILGAVPYPSIADIFYLSTYLFFFIGILRYPRYYHKDMVDAGWVWLDIFIIMFSAGGIFWNFLIGPAFLDHQQSWLAIAVNSAYPLGDLLLISSIALMVFLPRSPLWSRPINLLLIGHGLSVIADSVFTYQVINEVYTSGAFINILFSLSPLFLMLSGLSQAVVIQQVVFGQKTMPIFSQTSSLIIVRLVSPFVWLFFAYLLLDYGTSSKQVFTPAQISIWLGVIVVLIAIRNVVSTLDNRHLANKLQTMNDQLERRVVERTADLLHINTELRYEMDERKRIEMMLREREEKLTHFGLHDALTGLPNRSLLLDRLSQAVQHYNRHPEDVYAILFLDFDSFKVVNDSLGHPAGDKLLIQIGKRLSSLVRAEDTVARLGGDEFVILIRGFENSEFVTIIADRILQSMKDPFPVGGKSIYISASVGIVIANSGYKTAIEILRDADLAMYEAKTQGRARYVLFQPDLHLSIINRQALDTDLRRAIKNNEFVLHYQPIISLESGRIFGFEALIRWRHPKRGLMNPSEFISIAESNGFIDHITRWTLQEACLQLSHWRTRFPQTFPLILGINLSPISLRHPELLRWVRESLRVASLSPESLSLEIVESIFIQDPDLAESTFKDLRQLGVRVSLDDFGTGYSSLGYINKYSIDMIKIDRSFISRLTEAQEVDAVVRAITGLAHDLNYAIIAEGIETQAQLEFVKQAQCQYGQGFLFHKPLEKNAVDDLLLQLQTFVPSDGGQE